LTLPQGSAILKEKGAINMDLYAYTNIERLENIAEKNNIDIPRLRGYRLMSEEEPIKEDFSDVEVDECERLISARPLYKINALFHVYSAKTEKKNKKYIKDGKVLWNKIHGKFRKNLKFAIKRKKKAVNKQFSTFNKYVGRKDVLMVHARVGGNNWRYYDCDKTVATKPWFLEKVDDYFDNTYCDIYCKIGEE
jgi:hypothetical protein